MKVIIIAHELTDVGNTDSSVFSVFFGRYSVFFGIRNTDIGIGIGITDPGLIYTDGAAQMCYGQFCCRDFIKSLVVPIKL